ncbi:MAG: glycosyltransferase [Acetobacteraceae bacterium]
MAAADHSVSVIIPLYNGARYIQEALDSVFAQVLPAAEVIVVDDGSTDDGPDIVRRCSATHKLTLLHKENGGQSSARNFGIRHARGSLIALLDQDDIWYPNHLSELIGPFLTTEHRKIGWTYSNLDEIGADGRLHTRAALNLGSAEHPKLDLYKCLQEDMFILPSASLILRSAFEAVGGFDERLSGYEDDDLFVRLFVAGYHNIYFEEPLGQWRVYTGSSSFSARMATSRMIYARKLLDAFPDQPTFGRFYGRELLAPRFLRQVAETARDALRRGDLVTTETCLVDMEFLERQIAPEPMPYPLREELLVTAIIPLHNGGLVVREALRSILRQTRTVDEIIVVDDGSTDDGPAIVQEMAASDPRLRLIRRPFGGQASARNAGVEHAHGDLIAFLDQDDIWYVNHLEVLLGPFPDERPMELGWTYGDVDEIASDGSMLIRSYLGGQPGPHPKRDLFHCLRNDMNVFPSASLISRKAYLAVGGCDERLAAYEDDDLFVRLFQAGYENIHIPDPVCAWRRERSAGPDDAGRAASRRQYMRKLMQRFPDAPEAGRFFVRDLIAPRFFPGVLSDTRKAIESGTAEQQQEAIATLRLISGYLPPRRRTMLRMTLLPALRHPVLARAIMRYRIMLYNLSRWFF